jgi:hypothetical protein
MSREPSSYLGLCGPSLYLVLRGGITYKWGLHRVGPGITWMLPLEPFSPRTPAAASTDVSMSFDADSREASYCVRYLSGLYVSFLFHMARVIAAIFRAMVNLARLGLTFSRNNRR